MRPIPPRRNRYQLLKSPLQPGIPLDHLPHREIIQLMREHNNSSFVITPIPSFIDDVLVVRVDLLGGYWGGTGVDSPVFGVFGPEDGG